VSGNARVYGDAWVYGDARVSGNAWVYGDARVSGNAWVYGDAMVYGDNTICWFSKFGSSNRTTTVFLDKDKNVLIKCGCFEGTLQEFESQVKETHGDNKYGREYKTMIELIKIKFDK
jgi:hypothetical protein